MFVAELVVELLFPIFTRKIMKARTFSFFSLINLFQEKIPSYLMAR
jgi:UDP-3-O-acyl-N-acetylglucosamine deacetylase